jgi:hypothetical protein
MEGLIMNALEQEYRDNVEKNRLREERRVLALYAIGGAIGVGACVWATDLAIVLIAAPFIFMDAVRRYESRSRVCVNPPEDNDDDSFVEVGYREAPRLVRRTRPVMAAPTLQIVFAVVLMFAALGLLAWNWDHVSGRFVANMVALVGMFIVIAIQRVHAAWKRRHDAKLMLEWERRLEGTK